MEVMALTSCHGTTVFELGTMVAALDVLDEFTTFRPSRPFCGLPNESAVQFTHDIRLSLMTTAPKRYNTHVKRVMYAASFLDGPALAWFHKLLRSNVTAIWARTEDPDRPPMPHYWSSWPFLIAELRTIDAFLKALEAQFPENPDGLELSF